jgi:nucleoside-diphosphate-sugar epimerase
MTLPRLILTGASGFVGRHLLEAICDDWTVYGIARRSQARCGAPVHPNLSWFQVDIGDREALADVFGKIQDAGGADVVVHLAAHYDFTGEDHPEYFRTNVDGLRNMLDLSADIGVEQFFFSSSVAACELPPPGKTLDETSPPDGRHIYAQTKRIGETMVGGYKDRFKPVIVRFAAMFSDWCEYPPLYMFFETWLSDAWNRHVLGGKGESAIPYLHVSDAVAFLVRLLERRADWTPREILIASPDGATSHNALFAATMSHESSKPVSAVRMPKALCGPGMLARDLAGRVLGDRPFERPWMAEYIDTVMAIDASKTRARTGWAPRDRLEILRRLPFLLENRRTYPLDWHRLNRAAMKTVHVPQNLRLYQLLERHQAELVEAYSQALDDAHLPSYVNVSPEDHEWHHKMILRQLMNAVRTQDRHVLVAYCGDLAERRYRKGFREEDLSRAIAALDGVCTTVLARDPEANALATEIHEDISTPLKWGVDRIQETYESLAAADARRARAAAAAEPASVPGR